MKFNPHTRVHEHKFSLSYDIKYEIFHLLTGKAYIYNVQ